jgi:hypothetical protein
MAAGRQRAGFRAFGPQTGKNPTVHSESTVTPAAVAALKGDCRLAKDFASSTQTSGQPHRLAGCYDTVPCSLVKAPGVARDCAPNIAAIT